MTSTRPAPNGTSPTALSAFLRGIERRGAVFAHYQCGDAGAGDMVLAAAMRAFAGDAQTHAMAQWPQRFWSLLLASPRLRRPVPAGGRGRRATADDAVPAWLLQLEPGARAALLLRLATGLTQSDSATALGVSLDDYCRILQRALPRHGDGRADPATWRQLREHVHQQIKTLPDARLAHLAQLRAAALAPAPAARDKPPVRRRRGVLLVLWILLALCGLALAATFAWPQLQAMWAQRNAPAGIHSQPLPPAQPPAARFDARTRLLSHRDFELLADPQGLAASRELAFFSWLSAQPELHADGLAELRPMAGAGEDAGNDDPETPRETVDDGA